MIFWISVWALKMQSSSTSSETWLAPASTIATASSVPTTTRSRSETSRWLLTGFRMISPLIKPTRTAPTGW